MGNLMSLQFVIGRRLCFHCLSVISPVGVCMYVDKQSGSTNPVLSVRHVVLSARPNSSRQSPPIV